MLSKSVEFDLLYRIVSYKFHIGSSDISLHAKDYNMPRTICFISSGAGAEVAAPDVGTSDVVPVCGLQDVHYVINHPSHIPYDVSILFIIYFSCNRWRLFYICYFSLHCIVVMHLIWPYSQKNIFLVPF